MLAVAIASTGAASFAATTDAKGAKDPAKREKHIAHMIKRMDTNGDSRVSKQEMVAAMLSTFSVLDTNHDGALSEQELGAQKDVLKAYRAQVKAAPDAGHAKVIKISKGVVKNFARIDANHDGVISQGELEGVAMKVFDRRDKNNDGYIELSDFQK
jgi:Ca2+-binding EF-hand superfamily protein